MPKASRTGRGTVAGRSGQDAPDDGGGRLMERQTRIQRAAPMPELPELGGGAPSPPRRRPARPRPSGNRGRGRVTNPSAGYP